MKSLLDLKPAQNQAQQIFSIQPTDAKPKYASLLKANQSNYFPNWLGVQTKKASKYSKLNDFYQSTQNLTQEQKIKLGQQNPTLLRYNPQTQKFSGVLARQINGFDKLLERRQKNITKSQGLARSFLDQATINANVPNIVKQIVNDNALFSQYGIGPVSNKKIPLYAGRWLDPVSGSLKVLPKASSKYLNPASYTQKKQYLQARILNKWNQFVGVIQQFAKFSLLKPDQWQKNVIQKVSTAFQKQKQVVNFPGRIINQYKKWKVGLPLGSGGTTFWTWFGTSGLLGQLQTAIKEVVDAFNTKQQNKTTLDKLKKDANIKLLKVAQKALNQFSGLSKNYTPAQFSAALSYCYSWAASKLKQIKNTLLKITKIMNIPQNLSMLNVQALQKQMKQDKQLIRQTLAGKKGITAQSFKDLGIGKGSLKDVLAKASQSTRYYQTGIVQPFKDVVDSSPLFAGINFGSGILKNVPIMPKPNVVAGNIAGQAQIQPPVNVAASTVPKQSNTLTQEQQFKIFDALNAGTKAGQNDKNLQFIRNASKGLNFTKALQLATQVATGGQNWQSKKVAFNDAVTKYSNSIKGQ